jgi:predicted double-glycine peptidase
MKKIIDFPEVRQGKNYTCGASSTQAILYYYGISYREDELENFLNTSKGKGTHPQDIINFFKKLGFKVEGKQKMTIADLKKYLNKKIPILVAYQAWPDKSIDYKNDWKDGHYSVVIGIEGDKIIFEDPSIINKGYIKTEEFIKRWHDVEWGGKKYIHYGIMIYGKKPKYNSKKILKIE